MLQVTAVLRDNCDRPVINKDFADTLARGAGFTLLPNLSPEESTFEGEWEISIPQAVADSIEEEGPIAVPVHFGQSEIPIGTVAVYDASPRSTLVQLSVLVS